MQLIQDGHLTIGNPDLDWDIRDLTIVVEGGETFIYAATGRSGGIMTLELSDTSGLAQIIDGNTFNNTQRQVADGFAEVVEINGKSRVIFGGSDALSLRGFTVNSDNTLGTGYSNVTLAQGTDTISALLSVDIGSTNVMVVADEGTGTLTTYTNSTDGVHALHGAQASIGGPVELATATVSGAQFLLATDIEQQRIVAFEMAANGNLTETDSLGAAEGLGIHVPAAIEVVEAHGKTWVLVGAAGSSSISVMELTNTGALVATDHLTDTLATRFGGLQDMATVEVGDWAFAIVGGSDDGLSLFTLMPNGRMLHLETIVHDIGSGLQNIVAIEAVQMGDEIQVFVTSGTAEGITQFSIDVSQLGDVIAASTSGLAQTVTGTNDDDLVVASASGNDTLIGLGGDDILVAGAGNVEMWGGSGDDTFVVGYHDQTVAVMDFEAGGDLLDLSAFPLLHDVSRLDFTSTTDGADIQYGDTIINVQSANGQSLSAEDLFGATFSWASHFLYTPETVDGGGQPGGGIEESALGTVGDDVITGTGTGDEIFALAGNDTMSGMQGDDTLYGEAGNDVISGQNGNDSLYGGEGDDGIWGGSGDDFIAGGADEDLLVGSAGNDTLDGGGWNDTLRGEDGNDTLDGGWGADSLSGGFGDDSLEGGDGHDEIWGDHGHDRLSGGAGNDVLGGFIGNDTFFGGDGHDIIWGNDGLDRAWGGAGNDTLGGGNGNDTLYGDDGNDLVWGGDQDDWQFGGDGDDTVGGFAGDDVLFGGNGNDQIWGDIGNDVGYGGGGDDMMGGYTGNDTFYGGAGDDTLSGGEGDDVLNGGADADRFQFLGAIGQDVVEDFQHDVDVLHFGDASLSYNSLNMQQIGHDVVIAAQNGQVILLGTDISDLDAGDFLFG